MLSESLQAGSNTAARFAQQLDDAANFIFFDVPLPEREENGGFIASSLRRCPSGCLRLAVSFHSALALGSLLRYWNGPRVESEGAYGVWQGVSDEHNPQRSVRSELRH